MTGKELTEPYYCISCPYSFKNKTVIVTLPKGETVNISTTELRADGKIVRLGNVCSRLMAQLGKSFGRVVHFDLLIFACENGNDPENERNALTVNICVLRKKLKKANLPYAIDNAFGKGYVLRYENTEATADKLIDVYGV